jgi:hypothetical protein
MIPSKRLGGRVGAQKQGLHELQDTLQKILDGVWMIRICVITVSGNARPSFMINAACFRKSRFVYFVQGQCVLLTLSIPRVISLDHLVPSEKCIHWGQASCSGRLQAYDARGPRGEWENER